MLREQLLKKEIGSGAFRWRSHEITRIEGLSDAVFGFAITLLVVSLEVPKTFNELLARMQTPTETVPPFTRQSTCEKEENSETGG